MKTAHSLSTRRAVPLGEFPPATTPPLPREWSIVSPPAAWHPWRGGRQRKGPGQEATKGGGFTNTIRGVLQQQPVILYLRRWWQARVSGDVTTIKYLLFIRVRPVTLTDMSHITAGTPTDDRPLESAREGGRQQPTSCLASGQPGLGRGAGSNQGISRQGGSVPSCSALRVFLPSKR